MCLSNCFLQVIDLNVIFLKMNKVKITFFNIFFKALGNTLHSIVFVFGPGCFVFGIIWFIFYLIGYEFLDIKISDENIWKTYLLSGFLFIYCCNLFVLNAFFNAFRKDSDKQIASDYKNKQPFLESFVWVLISLVTLNSPLYFLSIYRFFFDEFLISYDNFDMYIDGFLAYGLTSYFLWYLINNFLINLYYLNKSVRKLSRFVDGKFNP